MENLRSYIRDIPDFPKKGILFRDISPLLGNPKAFQSVIAELAARWDGKADAIAVLDARGFIFGSPLALQLGLPLALVRKKGKLPFKSYQVSYGLEYGEDTLELHQDAFAPGARVLIVDDLLATGGTAAAAAELIEKTGAVVAGCAFVIELSGLEGRQKLGDYPIDSLLTY